MHRSLLRKLFPKLASGFIPVIYHFGKNIKADVIQFLVFANQIFCVKKSKSFLEYFLKTCILQNRFKKYEAHKMSMERVSHRLKLWRWCSAGGHPSRE